MAATVLDAPVLRDVEYKARPSLMHYLLIAQYEVRVEHYRREGDGWRYVEVTDPGLALELHPRDVNLLLADLYEGVSLPTEPSAADVDG